MTQREQEVTTTMADSMADLIGYYHDIQEEIKRLETSKEIAKLTLLERFKDGKLREYTTTSSLQAQATTRVFRSISVKEAEAMLDEDTFGKLCRTNTSVVLTVRLIKSKESDEDAKLL